MTTQVAIKRSAIFVHRWLGVGLCLLFLLWFPSGIGMMYWDFPGVSAADRLEHSPALDVSTIRLLPGEAYARSGLSQPPTQVRLNTFDGRPVYRLRDPDADSIVYADTGEEQLEVSEAMMLRVASAWTGQPPRAAIVEPVEQVDQWTVQGTFSNFSPLSKYSWPDGQQVYVSALTGEVVQYTTTASRIGAYLGPIPHWFYFTPLRKHGPEWSRVVIWSSGIGTVTALLGVVIGIWMYSPAKRYRYAGTPTSFPYRGQKRWHAVFGLIFGLAAATWAFSGMLSMDPFPMPTGGPNGGRSGPSVGDIPQALRGRMQLAAFEAKDPRQALTQLSGRGVKELSLTTFAGTAVYMATLAEGGTSIVPVDGEPRAEFDHQRIVDVVTEAALPAGLSEVRVLDQYDAYYLDRRRERPLPVILARANDAEQTRFYIDPKTARVVSTYSSGNWVNRWVYHGLHSLDFPLLYNHRPLWDIVVITFMVGGSALCFTSLILAWRVVGRKLSAAFDSGTARSGRPLGDDLAVDVK